MNQVISVLAFSRRWIHDLAICVKICMHLEVRVGLTHLWSSINWVSTSLSITLINPTLSPFRVPLPLSKFDVVWRKYQRLIIIFPRNFLYWQTSRAVRNLFSFSFIWTCFISKVAILVQISDWLGVVKRVASDWWVVSLHKVFLSEV